MADIIVLAVLLAITVPAAIYIIKAKKSGHKCIGCPNGASCGSAGKCSGNCSGCSHG